MAVLVDRGRVDLDKEVALQGKLRKSLYLKVTLSRYDEPSHSSRPMNYPQGTRNTHKKEQIVQNDLIFNSTTWDNSFNFVFPFVLYITVIVLFFF
jgi:hypothetical protein